MSSYSPSCTCWGGFCNGILKAIGVIGKAHLRLRQFKTGSGTSTLSFPSRNTMKYVDYVEMGLKSVTNTQMIWLHSTFKCNATKQPRVSRWYSLHAGILGGWPWPHPSCCCQDAYILLLTLSLSMSKQDFYRFALALRCSQQMNRGCKVSHPCGRRRAGELVIFDKQHTWRVSTLGISFCCSSVTTESLPVSNLQWMSQATEDWQLQATDCDASKISSCTKLRTPKTFHTAVTHR